MRWAFVALAAFVALGAVPVGAQWVLHPDGGTIGMPLAVLAPTPFRDFLVPGALLLGAVGGSQLAAGALVLLGRPQGRLAALGAGAILAGWIAVQVLLIGYASFWQPLMGGVALAELAVGWRVGR
ncbi:MAG: hypothetical protein QM704_11565 [Anaeromyxobacteraceae bacterium]